VCLPAALAAQGTVNPTLLAADPGETSAAARRAGPAGIVARVRASVVHVAVEISGARGKFVIERASSGFVADASGLVVTWARLVHEVNGATDKQLFVQLDDAENTRLPAAIVRTDDATGLALLRVTPPDAGLTPVVLGPDRPAAGEPVVVLARPAGQEMPAFGGVASPALAAVTLGGKEFGPDAVFLTDSRNDERCDGAPVFDSQGRVIGIYSSEHVQRDQREPTLEDLKRPSFGVVLPAGRIRGAFATEWKAAKNASLASADGGGAVHPNVAAVNRIAPSVVSVWAGDGDWPQLGAKDPGGVMRIEGLGSGVVLSKNGLVVANAHVCRVGEPRVRLADGRTFPAEIVKRHGTTNLALLQVKLPAGTSLVPAPCNVDDDALLGEVVLAVGNPLGTRCVVSAGVVSAKRDEEGGRIQADASLGNQNGGGAVVDATGRLLGIGDAGPVDAIESAFAMRGDRVSIDVNLSRFVGIRAVRAAFAKALEAAEADAEVRAAVAATEAERKARSTALTAMVEKTGGAMLNIKIFRNIAVQKEDDPFPPDPVWRLLGAGSGVIIDRSGLALSNWHVVDEATNADGSMVTDHKVTASAFGGKEYTVKVLSISREDDLSLLQLELEPGEQVQAVELGDSDALAIGEPVAAIGNPHFQANTITFGVVSAKEQKLKVKGRFKDLEHLLETDAAINGGNSGGALLDMNGRLVGINSAGGGTFNNKGYAIQVDHVRHTLLSLLLAAYKLRSPDLGMRVHDDGVKVLVFDTDPRGPAAKAGVKSGDRIVKLNDVDITWSPGFALTLLRQPAGAELTLHLERDGKPMPVKLTPVAAAVWAVVRQSGLLTRDFAYAEDPERVRTTAIALHRAFTGDAAGEPNVIPANVVVVDKVYGGEQPEGTDVQAGDLLLAVELLRADTETPVLVRLTGVDKLRDLWNDRHLGTYEGSAWSCWIARGNDVKKVEVTSKRLFW
jgi:S1-C subfamily serine protease